MTIIDGKSIAAAIREQIADDVTKLKNDKQITPGLAVVLVGEHPPSKLYVRNKVVACQKVGIDLFEFYLPAETSEFSLLSLLQELNNNDKVHGILVQLPLPLHINSSNIINMIDPSKDVDGFTASNLGKLITQQDCFVPCTPQGCMLLIKTVVDDLRGLNALVVGRSNIVGKPMLHLLLQENSTVTIAHSYSKNLRELCQNADILVAAVGKAKIIPGEWIKPGAIVIDVGISYNNENKISGDVEFDEAIKKAKAISPVPYGVGPMTITCLLKNTLKSAQQKRLTC